MKIDNSSSMTFQSKIKFVSPKFFKYKTMQFWRNPACENICHWDIKPIKSKKMCCGYRKNLELGFTEEVRSCIAGVVAKSGDKAPLFMHILNSNLNNKDAIELKQYFNGTNAILVGSKDEYSYSRVIFEKFKKYASANKLPLTIMQGLAQSWQAGLAYDSSKDTLFLCVNDIINPENYINNKRKLNEIFKKVDISPTDELEFVSKFKEYLILRGFISD